MNLLIFKGDGGDVLFDEGGGSLHSFLVQIFQFLAAGLIRELISKQKIKLDTNS